MRGAWTLVAALGLGLAASPAAAQEPPRLTVRVRQVAGASVYLDVGTLHGLATGDTLAVLRDTLAGPVGRVVVTAATEGRSVLAVVGDVFAVARGDALTLLLLRGPPPREAELGVPEVEPSPAAAEPPSTPERRPPADVAPVPALRPRPARHGRVALDFTGTRSVTRVGGADPVDVDRTFATPALRIDVTAPEAVGGFTVHTSARLAYRYSGDGLLQPATSARVYAASLERRFTAVPLEMVMGRFHSPAEMYSGFWDGLMLRVGRGGVGVGAIVGFEPDQWNEGFSTALPKATAFAEGSARGAGWRWRGDVSAHTVRPSDSLPAHTFVGLTQRLTAGSLSLSHDLQVDRHPSEGGWRVSRLRARAGLAVTDGIEVRAGVARRETYLLFRGGDPFAPRRDRLDAGLAVRGSAGFASVDVDVSRDADGRESRGASAYFSTFGLPGLDAVGLTGSVSRWSGDYGRTLTAAPGLSLDLPGATLRAGYRFGRTDYLDRAVTTHGVDASLDAPVGPGVRFSARGRVQFGDLLRSQTLDLTLYRIF